MESNDRISNLSLNIFLNIVIILNIVKNTIEHIIPILCFGFKKLSITMFYNTYKIIHFAVHYEVSIEGLQDYLRSYIIACPFEIATD